MLVYYELTFAISVCLSLAYVFFWHKHNNIHITLLYLLIPICNFGYLELARSSNLEEAILAVKITFLGGCFASLLIMLIICNLCNIKINTYARLGLFLLSTGVYASVMGIGRNTLFYKSLQLKSFYGISVLTDKEYGFMHTVFYLLVIFYFSLSLAALIYGFIKKENFPRRIIIMLFLPLLVSMLSFFLVRKFTSDIELLPVAYIFAQIIYILIVYQLELYDITDSSIDSLIEKNDTGFLSVDFDLRYLGSNDIVAEFFPAVKELVIDKPITDSEFMQATFVKWIIAFQKNERKNEFNYRSRKDDITCKITINYLFCNKRRRGYQFFITYNSVDVQYIELLANFNSDLEKEVQKKTENISLMHNKLIVSMAAMVESRDNSTGGHIKRTSQGVKILIDEMLHSGEHALSDSFCKNVIKAAPMHDLGKIAVDDAVLRKPGRFTPEEFEKMKAHSAEGARIVDEILKDTDDKDFHRIAVNVAHYHHERWDGSGYPDKLKGEEIPLEARIMSIADVYDALVSKRVYKDSMSFEKADSIIMEGMGTQFDPGLQKYYEAARPKLEAYYTSLDEKDS